MNLKKTSLLITYVFSFLIILSCQMSQEKENIDTIKESINQSIETAYSMIHKIDEKAFPISITAVDQDRVAILPNHHWEFSRTEFTKLDEISDSDVINAPYQSFDYKKRNSENNRIIPSFPVNKGEIIFGINSSNLDKYFAIKILDINKEGVKFKYEVITTDNIRFERYSERQALLQIMEKNDFELLNKLSKSNPSALNKCVRKAPSSTNMNLIMFTIKTSNIELFDKLLELNVNPEENCLKNKSLLMYACSNNNAHAVSKLLEIYKDKDNIVSESEIDCIRKRTKLKHLLKK